MWGALSARERPSQLANSRRGTAAPDHRDRRRARGRPASSRIIADGFLPDMAPRHDAIGKRGVSRAEAGGWRSRPPGYFGQIVGQLERRIRPFGRASS
jgi:hypothetical protein